ncbi:penicillin-binding protein 2 [Nocardioides agariphilus]|jgi:peptidoglycan glycosyltransferase|uniref:Penicillin-binding protein 2 n=1 Tax=Nocardioides agariphilus TaxID=433664 RepID=A0A930VPN2_9ACTN|nr:penicillin-binding protein 2 [Nocardioides agariphilus]MBF4768531.1 penicillin-binding protein 2 [Nocardioides agariphilus]
MNKPIRTISLFCMLLFIALMANATYLQYWQADALNKDGRNRRIIQEAFSRERGPILVDGETVALSVKSDDAYKFQRTYPTPFRYAPVTGWFSYYSQTGIEQTQNDVLSGDDSRLFVTRLVDLVNGNNTKGGRVSLTLDPKAQKAAYDGLRALGEDVQGAVVAINPTTGQILANVSLPTYDPNVLASHDFASVSENYDRLNQDPAKPLLNRAIQTTLPPGSTFKLVTAAAAIESGNYDASSMVPAGATYQLPLTSGETGLVDNEGRSQCNPKRIPFEVAMEWSCNTTFAQLAIEVGAEAMQKQAEAFGFNEHYLDDLGPQAVSVYPTGTDKPQTGQTGFGQFEVRATPLQMAMVAAGIANGGTVMKPYLVDEVQSADLDILDKTTTTPLHDAVSPTTANELTKLMVATVNEGTADDARIDGIEVAGKTGTAQSGVPGKPPYAWFVSFAPADDPQVAVAVMIESVPGKDTSEIAGGALGGPIAKAVMEAVIR